jgi:hypothetical protein
MAARYPLAALEELRRRLVDEARAELAGAVAEAQRAGRRAEEGARSLREWVERRRAAERELQGGGAPEVAVCGRWIARLRRDEQGLGAEAARLGEEAARSAAREERRRTLLVEAERQLRTVERHRELWESERRRVARVAEEAEQEDRALALAVSQRRT